MKKSRKVLSIMLALLMAVSCLGQIAVYANEVFYSVTFINENGDEMGSRIQVKKGSYIPTDDAEVQSMIALPYGGQPHDDGNGKHSVYSWDIDPATTQINANTVFTRIRTTENHKFDYGKPNFSFSKENSRGIVAQYPCSECGYLGEFGVEFGKPSLNGLPYKLVGSSVTGGDGTAYEGTLGLSELKTVISLLQRVGVPIPSYVNTILDVGNTIIGVVDDVVERTSTCARQGHLYADNPTYTWSEEYQKCVARFTCTRSDCETHYDGHYKEVPMEITGHVYAYPDCENAGSITHSARIIMPLGNDLDPQEFTTRFVEYPDHLKKLGHNYSDPASNNDASCQHNGTYSQVCSRCGKTLSGEIENSKLDHVKSAPITVSYSAPTCTKDGSRTVKYVCTMCGEEQEDKWERETTAIAKTGHDWNDPVVENYVVPSCTDGGSYDRVKYCKTCGEREVIEHVTVDAKAHEPGEPETIAVGSSTCTSGGTYDIVTKCKNCGEVLDTQHVVGETAAHKYEVTSHTNPTCEERGETVYTCKVCNHSYTEYENPTGHDAEYAQRYVEPTCSAYGYTEYYCTKCGDSYTEEDYETELKEHTWNDGEETIAPTCEGVGEKTFTCTVCGETRTEPINALGHDKKYTVTNPTCTNYGYKVESCKRDGCNYSKIIEEYAPKGHTEALPVTENEVEPSCTAEGSYDSVVYCKNCSVELRRETVHVKKTHHNNDKHLIQSTCTVQGYYEYHCKNCGEDYVGDFQPCKAHTPNVLSEEIAPDCEHAGVKAKIECSVCHNLIQDADEIPALGHTPVTDPAVPATCTLAGSTEGVHCAVCEKVLKAKTDIPAAHKPVAVKAVAPTFAKTGKTAGKKCSACGKVITPQKTVAKLVSPSLKKVTKAKKYFIAKWNKFNVDGYEIRYSLKKNMKKSTTVKAGKTKKSLKVKKLKSKKTYYVQIRGYKKVNGKTEYSAWSAKKKVTVK